MPLPTELAEISGAQELYDWFGFWPDFHDAEVLSVHLDRTGSSVLTIHAWDAWGVTGNKVDSDGFYVLQKDVIVKFLLDGITELSLEDFNHQNVLFGLELTKEDGGFRLTLDTSFGLYGSIKVKNLAIEMTPGAPDGKENSRVYRGGARPGTAEEEADFSSRQPPTKKQMR